MKIFCLANIGNTATDICLWSDNAVVQTARWPTPELLTNDWHWPAFAEGPVLAACVVPAIRQKLTAAGLPITWLSASHIHSLDFSGVDPSTIGADRLANAVAALQLCPLPAIVVDCGTAITLEAVDGQHRFRGGAILPGRLLARRALHTGTGQLPDVPMGADLPPVLGTCTADAIRAGIDRGLLGTVERLVRDTADALQAGLPAVAVGGDAPYFCRHLDCLQPAPAAFTMHGLAAIAATL